MNTVDDVSVNEASVGASAGAFAAAAVREVRAAIETVAEAIGEVRAEVADRLREADAKTFLNDLQEHISKLLSDTDELIDRYDGALKAKGIATYRVHRTEAEDRRTSGVRLATMHRVKGLEFDHVVIASVRDGVVPLRIAGTESDDPVVKREAEVNERALLYVAATRAKRDVMVTGFGERSSLLQTPVVV